jgi:nucleotide-binding universal stress UspA family protein
LAHLGKKVRHLILPAEFEPGPPPGLWRAARRFDGRDDERLFRELLVPVSGEEAGWHALEQAIVVAQREGSHLRGLHIVPSSVDRAGAEAVRERFDQLCREAKVNGRLILEDGSVAQTICDRARWNDLVVMNMLHPPASKTVKRLGSGMRQIIQQCPRPILVAPRTTSPLGKALLAYDGRPKAEEALFLATYLAQRWQISLVVIIVAEKGLDITAISIRARSYLAEHNVNAEILLEEGSAAKIILATAGSHNCDFLIMGGYGAKPIVETILGSTANYILRETVWPIFVCQ